VKQKPRKTEKTLQPIRALLDGTRWLDLMWTFEWHIYHFSIMLFVSYVDVLSRLHTICTAYTFTAEPCILFG